MFIAVDVSGTPGEGNYGNMGITACTKEGISNTVRTLEQYGLDPTSRKQALRDCILNNTKFNTPQYAGFCLRMERDATLEKLKLMSGLGRRPNLTLRKTIRRYHYLHFNLVRDQLEEFLTGHGYALTSLAVECDSDSRGFVADIGLRSVEPSYAHIIADAVAWANHRGIEPDGVISVDRVDQIANQLKRK